MGASATRSPACAGKMLLLDHVGAKSGTKRTSPLLYVRDGEDIVIVASKGGFPKHPAWFHNLRANPDTTVQVGSERRPVHARVAKPEERDRLWALAVEAYRGYEDYRPAARAARSRSSSSSPASLALRAALLGDRGRRHVGRRSPRAARGRPSCRGRRRS